MRYYGNELNPEFTFQCRIMVENECLFDVY